MQRRNCSGGMLGRVGGGGVGLWNHLSELLRGTPRAALSVGSKGTLKRRRRTRRDAPPALLIASYHFDCLDIPHIVLWSRPLGSTITGVIRRRSDNNMAYYHIYVHIAGERGEEKEKLGAGVQRGCTLRPPRMRVRGEGKEG